MSIMHMLSTKIKSELVILVFIIFLVLGLDYGLPVILYTFAVYLKGALLKFILMITIAKLGNLLC